MIALLSLIDIQGRFIYPLNMKPVVPCFRSGKCFLYKSDCFFYYFISIQFHAAKISESRQIFQLTEIPVDGGIS